MRNGNRRQQVSQWPQARWFVCMFFGLGILLLGTACSGEEPLPHGSGDTSVDAGSDIDGPPTFSFDAGAEQFNPGGLLASYHEGKLQTIDGEYGVPFLRRFESAVDLTKSNGFPELADGGYFYATYTGGFYAKETTTYRLVVIASDSVRVRLHGESVVEQWNAGEMITLEANLNLERGWHPLDILYARDLFRAHLQVWILPEDADAKPIAGDQLGYPQEPPDNSAVKSGKASLVSAGYYKVELDLQTDWPVKVGVEYEGAPTTLNDSVDTYSSHHRIVSYLLPGWAFTATFDVQDPWGRKVDVPPLSFETELLGLYDSGGLMGHYFNGQDFSTPKGERLDTIINMPESVDGNGGGSFGMWMQSNNFSVRWEGALWIEEPGDYTIFFGTDDGQRVFLDGEMIAGAWYNHGLAYVEGTRYLPKGWHPLVLEMFDANGAAAAKLEWEGPGIVHDVIPADALGHEWPNESPEPPVVTDTTTSTLDNPPGGRVRWRTSRLTTAELTYLGKTYTHDMWSTSASVDFYDLPEGASVTMLLKVTDKLGQTSEPVQVVVVTPSPPEPED